MGRYAWLSLIFENQIDLLFLLCKDDDIWDHVESFKNKCKVCSFLGKICAIAELKSLLEYSS